MRKPIISKHSLISCKFMAFPFSQWWLKHLKSSSSIAEKNLRTASQLPLGFMHSVI